MGYRKQKWRDDHDDHGEHFEDPIPLATPVAEEVGKFDDWHDVVAEIDHFSELPWPLSRFYQWCGAYERLSVRSEPTYSERAVLFNGLRRIIFWLQIRDQALRHQTNEKIAKIAGLLVAGSSWCPRWLARCWYLAAHAQSYPEVARRTVASRLWSSLCEHDLFFTCLDSVLTESTHVVGRVHRDSTSFEFRRLDELKIRATLIARIGSSHPRVGHGSKREELRALARVVAALSWRLDDIHPRVERDWVRNLGRAKAWQELRWTWNMIRPVSPEMSVDNKKGDAYEDPDWEDDASVGPPVVESALLARFAQAAAELGDSSMLKQVGWAAPRPIGIQSRESNRYDSDYPSSDSVPAIEVWSELIRAAIKLRIPGIVSNAFSLVLAEYRPFEHQKFGPKLIRLAFSALEKEWPEHPIVSKLKAIRAGRHVDASSLDMVLSRAPLRQLSAIDLDPRATEFTGAARLCGRRLINAYVEGGAEALEAELDVIVPLVRFPLDWRRQQMALGELITQSNGMLQGAAAQRCREIIEESGFLRPAEKDDLSLFQWCRNSCAKYHEVDDIDSGFDKLRAFLDMPMGGSHAGISAKRNEQILDIVIDSCRNWVLSRSENDSNSRYLREILVALRLNGLAVAEAGDLRILLRDWVKVGLYEISIVIGQTTSTAVHNWKSRAWRRYLEHIRKAQSIDDMFVRSRLHYLRQDFGSILGLVTSLRTPTGRRSDLWTSILAATEKFFEKDENSHAYFPDWLKPIWSRPKDLPPILSVDVLHAGELDNVVYELLNNAYKALSPSNYRVLLPNNAYKALSPSNPERGCLSVEFSRSSDSLWWQVVWRNPVLNPTSGTSAGRGSIDEFLEKFVSNSSRTDTLDGPDWAEPDYFETRLLFPVAKRKIRKSGGR